MPFPHTQRHIPLQVHGQGIFVFESQSPAIFFIYNKHENDGLRVEFTQNKVIVTMVYSNKTLQDPDNKRGLSPNPSAFYWFSLDSQNQILMAGIGEPRLETVTYTYGFSKSEENKKFLESMTAIELPRNSLTIKALSIINDPVTSQVPLYVKPTDELNMLDIAKGNVMPSANLSQVNQKLYNCISGKKFVLDDPDFPDFSKAIEYSIATPGLWCNTRLKEKANEFSKDKPNILETYLRITLGQNNGESPGVPYVMEIWPPAHYSPIHSHAAANAVIRVLHGTIHVNLYPFLGAEEPFGSADFKKDDVTWISPGLNQVHMLSNVKTQTCVTIQTYMYDETNKGHYDYFDYLDENGATRQYEPDSDMDFVQFKALIKKEWLARHTSRCFSYWS
jgi:hypothetical protein